MDKRLGRRALRKRCFREAAAIIECMDMDAVIGENFYFDQIEAGHGEFLTQIHREIVDYLHRRADSANVGEK